MRLQLDTKQKTIKLEESVNLGELQDMLEKLLPKNQWKEYKLEPQIIQSWSNPIIIDRYRPWPSYPWTPYYQAKSGSLSGNTEIYNLEVN